MGDFAAMRVVRTLAQNGPCQFEIDSVGNAAKLNRCNMCYWTDLNPIGDVLAGLLALSG